MKKILISSLLATVLFGFSSQDAEAVCLDYWLKGPSACKDNPEDKNKIIINGTIDGNVDKDEARIQYEANLNKKIDKFLVNYGKPPREFAAFHLDPTLENAVRWVKKFNEEHERTMKVAVAWKQADYLFRQYRETGEITLPAESGVTPAQVKYLKKAFEDDATDLPKVKGFGVDLPGNWDEDRLSRNYAKLNYKEKTDSEIKDVLEKGNPVSIYGLPALEKQISESRSMEDVVKEAADMLSDEDKNAFMGLFKGGKTDTAQAEKMQRTTKEKTKKAGKTPLEISYYFSAKCPFCKQFKPELQDAIASYGKENVKLTCVDMTPGDRNPSNKEDLDCNWRPLLTGEQKQFGVAKTPTIIVKRGQAKQLELLENYHDSDVLIDYFTNGPKM